MRDIQEHIKNVEACRFECEAGWLTNNQNWQDIKSLVSANADLLDDLLEYFDGKQDAETFPDGHTIANEEMKFHMRISAILEGK